MDTCKIVLPNKSLESRSCSYVRFPNHPHPHFRKPCDVLLLKNVRTSAGTVSLYPRQLFCYKSVIDSLKVLISRPGFYEKCELWRTRLVPEDSLMDIYDGKFWKEFLNPGGIPFLSLPYNFTFCLNVDWFQPFKNT